MIIAVEKGLDNIKQALLSKGYRVVELGVQTQAVDAAVYVSPQAAAMLYEGSISAFSSASLQSGGVLLINAAGKSAEQISAILASKVYSPLF